MFVMMAESQRQWPQQRNASNGIARTISTKKAKAVNTTTTTMTTTTALNAKH
jgi:hypothetical protein